MMNSLSLSIYKTGARDPSVDTMRGERPDEPQLPLYLVASQPDATAVVFAQVKNGKNENSKH